MIFLRISTAQGSSLTVFVNCVNSLRKFEGGGGLGRQNRVTALQSHRMIALLSMNQSYFPLQSRGVLNDQEQWRGDLVF